MDVEIRILERSLKSDPENEFLKYKLRRSCFLADRSDTLSIETGDIVEVYETESPWINGYWFGTVAKAMEGGDKYIKPAEQAWNYRVIPNNDYLSKGLYLTREDICVIKELRPISDVVYPETPTGVYEKILPHCHTNLGQIVEPSLVPTLPDVGQPTLPTLPTVIRINNSANQRPQNFLDKVKTWLGLGS